MKVLLLLALAQAPITARVIQVVDGDTIAVRRNGLTEKVRLLGVDAPEKATRGFLAQPGARASTTALRRLVLGRDVELSIDRGACPTTHERGCVDRYQRALRYVSIRGRDVSNELVAGGHARAYLTGPLESAVGATLCQVEARARAEKRGIWKLKKNAKKSQCPKGVVQ